MHLQLLLGQRRMEHRIHLDLMTGSSSDITCSVGLPAWRFDA